MIVCVAMCMFVVTMVVSVRKLGFPCESLLDVLGGCKRICLDSCAICISLMLWVGDGVGDGFVGWDGLKVLFRHAWRFQGLVVLL